MAGGLPDPPDRHGVFLCRTGRTRGRGDYSRQVRPGHARKDLVAAKAADRGLGGRTEEEILEADDEAKVKAAPGVLCGHRSDLVSGASQP